MTVSTLRNKTIVAVLWSGIERFSAQGLAFIFGIILARLLSPEDYGIVAILSIFIAVAGSITDGGFSRALIRLGKYNPNDLSTTFYFNLSVSIICYLLLFTLIPYIADFYNIPILIPAARIIGLSIILNATCLIQQTILSIKIDFKTQTKISLSATIFSNIAAIIAAINSLGLWSLAIQIVSNAFIRAILFWSLSKWHPLFCFSIRSFKKLFSFGSKLLLSNLLESFFSNIYSLVIGKFYQSADLGFYSRAKAISQIPTTTMTEILDRVTYPVLSNIKDNKQRLSESYKIILRLSTYIIFPLMFLLSVSAAPLVDLLLTHKWHNTAVLISLLCFSTMLYHIHAINLNLLLVKGQSDVFLKLEIIKKVISITLLIITLQFGLIAICCGQILSSYIALYLNTYYSGKFIDLPFSKQIKLYLPIFINCIVMISICLLLQSISDSSAIKLLTTIIVGLTYYLISSKLIHKKELHELTLIIRQLKLKQNGL